MKRVTSYFITYANSVGIPIVTACLQRITLLVLTPIAFNVQWHFSKNNSYKRMRLTNKVNHNTVFLRKTSTCA